MTAQQIEELVVCTACIALGVTMLAIKPDRFPVPLRSWAEGKYRVPIAVGAILVGAMLIAAQLLG